MLPSSLLAPTASLLVPLITASSTPICVPSIDGYQVAQLYNLYKIFCGDLAKDGFTTDQEVYGVPTISLNFVPADGADKCDQSNCLSTFEALIQSCALNSKSIFGTGSIDAGCGTYNFTVWNTTTNPIEIATNTIGAASATRTPILLNLPSSKQTSISTSAGMPTATKPRVGSTALGTSDAVIIQVSGFILIGVAFIFTWLL